MQQILILGGGAARSGRCAGGSTDRRGPRTHHRAGQKTRRWAKSFWPPATGAAISTTGTSRRSGISQPAQSPAPPAERRGRGYAAGVVREPRPLPPHRRGRAGVPVFQSGGGRTGPAGAPSVETGRRGAHRLHRPEPESEPGRLCRPNRDRGGPRDPAGRRRHLRHGRRCRPLSSAPMASAPGSPPSAADGWPPSIPA